MDSQDTDRDVSGEFAAFAWWVALREMDKTFPMDRLDNVLLGRQLLIRMERNMSGVTRASLSTMMDAYANPSAYKIDNHKLRIKGQWEEFLKALAADEKAEGIISRLKSIPLPVARPIEVIASEPVQPQLQEPEWGKATDAQALDWLNRVAAGGALPSRHGNFLLRCINYYRLHAKSEGQKRAEYVPPEALGLPPTWLDDLRKERDREKMVSPGHARLMGRGIARDLGLNVSPAPEPEPVKPEPEPVMTPRLAAHIAQIYAFKKRLRNYPRIVAPNKINEVFAALGLTDDVLERPEDHLKTVKDITLGKVIKALKGDIPDGALAVKAKLALDLPLIKADKFPLTSEDLQPDLYELAYRLVQNWHDRGQGAAIKKMLDPNGPLPTDPAEILKAIADGTYPLSRDQTAEGRAKRNDLFRLVAKYVQDITGLPNDQLGAMANKNIGWFNSMMVGRDVAISIDDFTAFANGARSALVAHAKGELQVERRGGRKKADLVTKSGEEPATGRSR